LTRMLPEHQDVVQAGENVLFDSKSWSSPGPAVGDRGPVGTVVRIRARVRSGCAGVHYCGRWFSFCATGRQ
jgi:hypothetical protein